MEIYTNGKESDVIDNAWKAQIALFGSVS